MGLIETTTTAIHTDEVCLNLVEMNLTRPGKPGLDRYMIVTVLRQEKPVDFWIDLGPASQFTRPQVRIPTGGQDPTTGKWWSEHNVGQAVEMANYIREGPFEQPEPVFQTPDLIQIYLDQPDIRRRHRKKMSTFGHGQATQRS